MQLERVSERLRSSCGEDKLALLIFPEGTLVTGNTRPKSLAHAEKLGSTSSLLPLIPSLTSLQSPISSTPSYHAQPDYFSRPPSRSSLSSATNSGLQTPHPRPHPPLPLPHRPHPRLPGYLPLALPRRPLQPLHLVQERPTPLYPLPPPHLGRQDRRTDWRLGERGRRNRGGEGRV